MYKVLIVDDSIQDINGLTKCIDWDKYECEVVGTALNGMEGIQKAKELAPDIIVTDISMPLIDGIELTKKVNEIYSDMKYIYISCMDDSEFLKSALDNEVVAYVYKPIDTVVFAKSLEKAVTKLREKKRTKKLNNMLKEQIELNRSYLIEEYLKDVIATGIVNISRAELLNFPINQGYYFVFAQFDDSDSVLFDDTYSCYLQLKNLLSDSFMQYDSYIVSYDWSKLVVLVKDVVSVESIVDMLSDIQGDFVEQSAYTFSAFITPEKHMIDELDKIFRTVIVVVEQQYYQQKNQIIMLDSELKMISFKPKFEISVFVEKLDEYISAENYEQIKLMLDSYIDDTLNCSISYIKSLCFNCISALNIVLIERDESFSNIFDDETLIWKKLSKVSNNMNVKQWLLNIFDLTAKYLNNKTTKDKYKHIADKIKQYIDENYTSYTLSDEIAKEYFITFDYANKIFKRYYHQTIYKYATDKKIEYAKRLLTTTNRRMTDIAELLGYSSNIYFSVAFKKHTGIAPSEYREKNLKITE